MSQARAWRRLGAALNLIAARRLAAQQIARPTYGTPAELVGWLGAVQAQDYGAARWAVGLRLPSATDAAVEQAIADGPIIRTHAMRFTWQLIARNDVRWILALVKPRLLARYAGRYRELALDAATLRRCNRALEEALGDGAMLTRDEVATLLARARIATDGQRLAHILAWAELHGTICSGARRGKQHTYALLDLRAPNARSLDADAALAELAARYFQSRGPATPSDIAWWAGLAMADARRALESVAASLVRETIDGRSYWRGPGTPATSRAVHLLPAFDEYLIAYKDRTAVLDPKHAKRMIGGGGILPPCVVAGGRVIGTWRRELAKAAVSIALELFAASAPPARRAILSAAQRYGAFLGLAAEVHASGRW